MTRFNKINKTLFPIFSLFLLTGFFTNNAFSQKQPNILWITIEDTSPHFIGSYGDTSARTPNIDKIVNSGIKFTNAFSTGTVCSPSRTTLITGVRVFENGTGNHRSDNPIPSFMLGFPQYMQQAGYYTTNNSKTDYNVANEKAFTQRTWDESSKTAGWWNRKRGQPFFSVFNFTDSHQSRTMTDTYANYQKNVLENLTDSERIGDNEFAMPPIYHDSPEMRKQFARVYNSIKYTDNKIGELLSRLQKDGLTDSTIIFFFSDHGEGIPRGKTNGINLGYRVPFAIWFPPMHKNLSPWGMGMATNELINFDDLPPTLLSLAGISVPKYMKGRVLIGKERSKLVDHIELSTDRTDNGIDMIRSITDGKYMYSRNYMPFMPETRYINYMEIGEIKQIMRKDLAANKLSPLQKSLFEPRPAEFLFDTSKDPWETTNLANHPDFQTQLIKMRSQLDNAVIKSKDIMFLPEYELVNISKTTTPYEFRLDKDKFPITDIYAAASLAGMRGKDIAAKQIKFLSSPNKIIRYWAALGLRSQNLETLKPYKLQILKAVKDAYPPTSITASAVAFDVFADKTAEQILKTSIGDKNKQVAMLAINYLLYVKNKQPFIATVQNLKNEPDINIKGAFDDFLASLNLLEYNRKTKTY